LTASPTTRPLTLTAGELLCAVDGGDREVGVHRRAHRPADHYADGSTDPFSRWTKTRCTTPKSDTGLPADITTLPEPETWGLGIDDGPNCTNTVLYDFFKQQNPPQKASLYYIGS